MSSLPPKDIVEGQNMDPECHLSDEETVKYLKTALLAGEVDLGKARNQVGS